MSTAGSRTGYFRRVAKGALAAALIAMVMWGAAAIARSSAPRSSVVRAGNSWSYAVDALTDQGLGLLS